MWSTVCALFFFSFLRMLLRDAGLPLSEWRNNQCECIAAGVTLCKYVYLDAQGMSATTNKVCLEVCAFAECV